jgi:hypothetical protein
MRQSNACCLVAFLASLVLFTPVTKAGDVAPTWVETVTTNYFLGMNGPSSVTSVSPVSGSSTTIDDYHDPRGSSGVTTSALVDYQGTSADPTLYVTFAAWNMNPSFPTPVDLYVYSYSPSAQPPQLNAPPDGSLLYSLSLPGGVYTNNLPITLDGPNSDGSQCFLLEVQASVLSGPPLVTFSTAVPEPTSIVIIGGGLAVVLALAFVTSHRGIIRRPFGRHCSVEV